MLKKVSDSGITEAVVNANDPHARVKSLLHYSPDWFIGKDVYKDFPDHGGVYHGIVLSTRVLPNTDTVVWRILYDDKDTEDYDIEQMIDFCILKVDGTNSAPAAADAQAPPDAVDEPKPAGSGTATGEQLKQSLTALPIGPSDDTSGAATTPATVPRDVDLFKDVEVYSTLDNQTFLDVCSSMGL